MDISQKI